MEENKTFGQKVKEFISKYKTQILIALGAISSIAVSLSVMEGVDAFLCSLVISIVAILIEVLKNGASDLAVELLAKTIKIIIDELTKAQEKKPEEAMAANNDIYEAPSVEEIKEKLIA